MPRIWSASGMTRLLCTYRGFASHLRGPVLDRFHDVHVAGAPAQVARDSASDVVLRRARIGCQQCLGDHQHPWRAEAALESVLLPEAFLERVELTRLFQTLDGFDLATVSLNGQQRAGLERNTVDDDRTCAAIGGVAADVCASQIEGIAEEVHQQEARLHLSAMACAIDGERDRGESQRLTHAAPPCARARARRRARRVNSRTIARL